MKPSDILPPRPAYDPVAHAQRTAKQVNDYPLQQDDDFDKHAVLIAKRIHKEATRKPSTDFQVYYAQCIRDLFVENEIFLVEKPSEYTREGLDAVQRRLTQERIDRAADVVVGFGKAILDFVPEASFSDAPSDPAAPTVTFIELCRQPREVVQGACDVALHATLASDNEAFIFDRTRAQVVRNILLASGHHPDKYTSGKIVLPMESDLGPVDLVKTYLKDTDFTDFFLQKMPFAIPDHPYRFEHTHIVGGSGHGKSTLLTQQFVADVKRKDSPAIIVIDGKGTFAQELQRFKLFEPGSRNAERLVILNPQDAMHPPALNMFAPPPRPAGIPIEVQRQIENSAIELFEYVFAAKDFELTAKQKTCLSYAARLLFSVKPTATITTLLDLLSERSGKEGGVPESSPFKPYVEQQPAVVQRFFNDLFYHPTEYGETKRQIQNRIFDLLENPAFTSMFSAAECRIDFFDILQNRKILIVNSSPGVVGEKGAPMLGRYVIARTLSSIYARLGIEKSAWAPAFLMVDEAQMFVDEEKTQPLLQQAREFNLGVTLAHQKLADLTPKLIATVTGNTSIKYAGGVSAADASALAKDMNCEADFIMGQRKSTTTTSFACSVRGLTPQAVSITLPLGLLDNEPKMSRSDYANVLQRNRQRLSPSIAPVAASLAQEPPSPPPKDDQPKAGSIWKKIDPGEPSSSW